MRDVLVTLIGVICIAAAPSIAEDTGGLKPDGAPDFTFKRVAAPTPGAVRRITVQIDPLAQERAMAALKAERLVQEEATAKSATAGAYDWFWSEVSAKAEDAGPQNIARALTLVSGDTALTPPRLQSLQDIAAAFGPAILMSTVGTKVSPALVLALISVESSGRAGVTSDKGAQGLMQLIPATAERFGVSDASDPVENIKGGVAYLEWLMAHFDGDPILALAGYNAGENAVTKHGGVPPFDETRGYVPKVLNAWTVARGLCMTPPELLTDGCVFAVNGTTKNG